ncbi:hypothetical protein AAFF_G00248560 [Aldrovandia affinis]|uniref:Uncharacterized protein n=1 Tax=Aldrovandia affinis TaxID=143900 RepID=A0AAD7RD35_9TELE|nr:hypothetical protein AAFF_G00248560 [Aldrovandia affinis]
MVSAGTEPVFECYTRAPLTTWAGRLPEEEEEEEEEVFRLRPAQEPRGTLPNAAPDRDSPPGPVWAMIRESSVQDCGHSQGVKTHNGLPRKSANVRLPGGLVVTSFGAGHCDRGSYPPAVAVSALTGTVPPPHTPALTVPEHLSQGRKRRQIGAKTNPLSLEPVTPLMLKSESSCPGYLRWFDDPSQPRYSHLDNKVEQVVVVTFPSLCYRDLRGNLISTIAPGAFLGLTELRKLLTQGFDSRLDATGPQSGGEPRVAQSLDRSVLDRAA